MYINKNFWEEVNKIIEKFLDTDISIGEAKKEISDIIKSHEKENGELSLSIDVDSLFNVINRSDFNTEDIYSYNYDDDDVDYKNSDDDYIYGDNDDTYSY